MARIDVTAEMAACVKALGGEVLDEILPPTRDYKNADYSFGADGIIVELKIVETEVANDETFISRASKLHERWLAEGRIAPSISQPKGDGLFEFSTSDLPDDCVHELLGIVRERVFRELFKKASAQIKQTRERRGPADAKGLLLLCVDSDTGLSLRVVWHVIGALMMRHGSRFRGIDSIVAFSANYAVGLPGQPQFRPWMFITGPDRPPIDAAFVRRLGVAWQERIAAHGGHQVLPMGDGTGAVLDDLLGVNFQPIA
ncbi:MAG: hypothetical protein ACK5ZS_00480 [bacterium]